MAYQNLQVEEQASWFKQNLRKVVGWSYIAADAAMAGRGMSVMKGIDKQLAPLTATDALKKENANKIESLLKERNAAKSEFGGMVIWGIGGLGMAIFGNRTVEKEFNALEDKLAAYLHDQGVKLEGDALEIALREKNKSVLKKIEDFAYQYPSEIMHACFAIGSVGLINSGIADYFGKKVDGKWEKPETPRIGTLGMGVSVIIGALIGLLVREKTPAELAKLGPANGITDKTSRWLQKNANKATSAFYLANNGFSALSVYEDHQTYRNPEYKVGGKSKYDAKRAEISEFKNLFGWRIGALSTYIFGAGVLATTSKSSGVAGGMGEKAKAHLYDDVAEIVRSQPKEAQQLMVGMVAEYLATRRELGMAQMDAKEISDKINEALAGEMDKAKNWSDKALAAVHQPKKETENWVDTAKNVPTGSGKTV